MTTLEDIRDEEGWIRERYWHPQPGQVVLDIGSYEGAYTIPALEAGATVVAVDARAHTLNAIPDHPCLTKLHRALYDGGEYPPALVDAIAASEFASSRDMAPDVGVEWTTVDGLALEHVDMIKIDVEGGELGVLRGAHKTLRRDHPFLLIEEHSRVYPWVAGQNTSKRIQGILRSLGYRVKMVPDTHVDYIVASA